LKNVKKLKEQCIKNIPGKIIRFKVFQTSLKNGIFLEGYLFTFFGQFLEVNNCQIVSKTTIEGFPRFCKLLLEETLNPSV
jgi:hypothetical protein